MVLINLILKVFYSKTFIVAVKYKYRILFEVKNTNIEENMTVAYGLHVYILLYWTVYILELLFFLILNEINLVGHAIRSMIGRLTNTQLINLIFFF